MSGSSSSRPLSLRRIVVPVVTIGMVLLSSGAWAPMPRGLDGITLCYPLVGPVLRLNPDLPANERARIRAHEEAHAAHCRAVGALRHYLGQLTPSGRLTTEAVASCAEAEFEVGRGASAYMEHERIVDELRDGYRWFRQIPEGRVRGAIRDACPALAAAEPPPWVRRHD